MAEHNASIAWKRSTTDFDYDSFNRDHRVTYGPSLSTPAGWARHPDMADPKWLDPEIALVGALSSCFMLTFLAIAARKRLVVDTYDDAATGHLETPEAEKVPRITRIVLRPRVRFEVPQTAEVLAKMYESAHRNCFIANSIKSEITIEPQV